MVFLHQERVRREEREKESFVLFCFHQITKEMQRKQQNGFLIILFFLRLFIHFFLQKKREVESTFCSCWRYSSASRPLMMDNIFTGCCNTFNGQYCRHFIFFEFTSNGGWWFTALFLDQFVTFECHYRFYFASI